MTSGSDRQLADAAAMLDIGRHSLDLAYVERWVADAWPQTAWSRAHQLREPD